MSAYRKRRLDDNSSSNSDEDLPSTSSDRVEDLPSVKRKRSSIWEKIKKLDYTSRLRYAVHWFDLDLPLKPWFENMLISEALKEYKEVIESEEESDDDIDIAVIDGTVLRVQEKSPYVQLTEKILENPVYRPLKKEETTEIQAQPMMPSMFDGTLIEPSDTSHSTVMNGKDPLTYKKNSEYFSKGYTAYEDEELPPKFTPLYYRDGTRVGFRTDVSPINLYHSNVPKGNFQKPLKLNGMNGRCIAPITNPGSDVDILLDSPEVSKLHSLSLKIMSEISCGKRSNKVSWPMMPFMFGNTSFEPRDPALEALRSQEKIVYGLLFEKILKNPSYRPMKKKETTVIKKDETQNNRKDDVMAYPFDKESLQENVADFIKEYYKPCQLVPKVSTNSTQPKKSSKRNEGKEEMSAVLTEYRYKER